MPNDQQEPRERLLFEESALEGETAQDVGVVGEDDSVDGRDLAQALLLRVTQHKKETARLERSLKNLAERWSDPKVVAKELGTIGSVETEFSAPSAPSAPLIDKIRDLGAKGESWLENERLDRRDRLARELKAACSALGVPLSIVTRDPLEIRLAPLSVMIDLDQGRATLQFGRQELLHCPTDAAEIVTARTKALAQLERKGWTPEVFHGELREAWKKAAARGGRGDDWIELAEVLPELAFSIQTRRWRRDPKSRHYTDYGKAQMIFELHRLRECGALSRDSWRLVLGPATGSSTRDKGRVFWIEDGTTGRGSYHLTLRFVRNEESHDESR